MGTVCDLLCTNILNCRPLGVLEKYNVKRFKFLIIKMHHNPVFLEHLGPWKDSKVLNTKLYPGNKNDHFNSDFARLDYSGQTNHIKHERLN